MSTPEEAIITCFRVLEVEPFAPLEEVKQARRDLALIWHPDRFQNNERLRLKAEERLKDINQAYDTVVGFYHRVEKAGWGEEEQRRRAAEQRRREEEQRKRKQRKAQAHHRKAEEERRTRAEGERREESAKQGRRKASHAERNAKYASFLSRTALIVVGICVSLGLVAVVTQQKPSPPPEPPAPVEVPNDQELEQPEAPPPPPEEEEEDEPEVFMVVEEDPELIGGLAGLQKEVEYPEFARKAGIEGRVFVQFIVDENGNVTQPTVLRSPHKLLSEEALRVIREAKFKPGKQRGKAVKVKMSLPVTFALR